MITEELIKLIDNYQQDIAEYGQLYEDMAKFQQNLPVNPVTELKDEEELPKNSDYAEILNQYMQKRDQQFAVILERTQASNQIIGELAENLGLDQFNLTNLKQAAVDPDLMLKLEETLETLTTAMEKVIALDQQIADKLKMDYEATKLQVQRLSSSRRVKNAYRNEQQTEAFFIDKNK